MEEKITYVSEIISALKKLDGMATLNEINDIIALRNNLPSIHTNVNWKDNVRATLQRHCSDTRSFRGANDLFYSVYGLGEGVWGLREYINLQDNYEMNVFEQRLVQNVLSDDSVSETERTTIIQARRGQGEFRRDLLQIFNKCIITGIENKNLLIASHIKPWRSSDNIERLSSDNGIILSPLYDKLFDLGYISFDKNTKIIISDKLSQSDKKSICFDMSRIFIPNCTYAMKMNFEYHNDMIFKK